MEDRLQNQIPNSTVDDWDSDDRFKTEEFLKVDAVSGSTYDMLEMRDVGTAPWQTQAKHAGMTQAASRQSHTATYIVAGCVIVLAMFSLLGGILNVGDHLMLANGVLGWLYYILIVVAIIASVVLPLIKVAKRPVFSLYQLRDESGHAHKRHCRMLADNLIVNADLTPDEMMQVESYVTAGDEADDLLIEFFKEKCVPLIDEQTKRSATTAFLASVISHSALVETVTMLSVSLDLVRGIVEKCGFRPTNLGLARIYSRVMISALIAGGIEDSDLSDIMGNLLGGGAGARASGMIMGSATSGLVSAFLVFRVGVITKRWLCAEDGPAQMAAIRRTSYKEALTMMRTSGFMATVAEVVKKTASRVVTSAGDAVVNAARNAAQGAQGAVVAAAGTAGTAMSQAANAAIGGVVNMTQSATSAVTRGATGAAEMAAHAAGTAIGGVREMAHAAGDTLSWFLSRLKDDDDTLKLG
ncbi:MAG: hypothetical protein IKE43_03950 [Coriobacteriales bacterium]|nr:hypothetical protein [Coriobacteriales bacterium]